MNTGSNLRKAAVLIRSLDAGSAATLLGQLSPAEAASVRDALRTLGPVDTDEQADILAEFRRAKPLATEPARHGVELALSNQAGRRGLPDAVERQPNGATGKRFDFLENAPTSVLVTYLAREHAQTIAVVLSHLAPARAADVLAALPEKLQADTIERLSILGETDPESVTVLESELATWVARRDGGPAQRGRRQEMIAAILTAADAKTRNGILANLKTHKSELAKQLAPRVPTQSQPLINSKGRARRVHAPALDKVVKERELKPRRLPEPPAPSPKAIPRIKFDDLIHLDDRTLATLLHGLDPNALALALAGSSDEMVDRICAQMPKRTAKTFRRELRRLGPTRLSDVEAAQRLVADLAAEQLARRRSCPAAQIA
ncbi:MAG: FliG C-terminal domain-containing protein [Pirellulales bacterium]